MNTTEVSMAKPLACKIERWSFNKRKKQVVSEIKKLKNNNIVAPIVILSDSLNSLSLGLILRKFFIKIVKKPAVRMPPHPTRKKLTMTIGNKIVLNGTSLSSSFNSAERAIKTGIINHKIN